MLQFLLPLLGIAALSLVAIFWGRILNWARDSLIPWVRKNIPEISKFVEDAFVVLDKLVVSARKLAIAAWERVREHLLSSVIEFFLDGSVWKRKTENYVKDNNDDVHHITEVKKVDYEDLPEEVREEYIRRRNNYKIDVTKLKDEEIQQMTMQQ